MSDEYLISDYLPDNPNHKIGILRYLAAILTGILSGAIIIAAIMDGVSRNYSDEQTLVSWGFMYWGDHYIIRVLWSFVATAWGSFLAGLIARKNGKMIAVISSIPSIVLWTIAIFIWASGMELFNLYQYEVPGLGNKIISFIIPVATIIVSIIFGLLGEEISARYSDHFDSRRNSFLGIKWYNIIWVTIPLFLLVAQSAWAIDYALSWWKISWGDVGIYNIVPGLFLFGIISTLYFTWIGITRAYDYLSNYSEEYALGTAVKGVLLYGLGLPLLAILLQVLIMLIHYGLYTLLT